MEGGRPQSYNPEGSLSRAWAFPLSPQLVGGSECRCGVWFRLLDSISTIATPFVAANSWGGGGGQGVGVQLALAQWGAGT